MLPEEYGGKAGSLNDIHGKNQYNHMTDKNKQL